MILLVYSTSSMRREQVMGGYVIAKHHVLGHSVSNYTLKIEILKPITTNDKKLIITV